SKGSTAMDLAGIGGVMAVKDGAAIVGKTALAAGFERKNWKASKPAATTASATVTPTSLRPALRGMESLGKTSSARLIPSGVISNAHERMSAAGKPETITTTKTFITQGGASKVGN